MPKSKQCTLVKSGKRSDGVEWKLYDILSEEDGKTYKSFEPIEAGEEFMLVDGKDGGEKLAKKPKPQGGGKFPMKDYTFDKRKASLDASIAWLKGNEKSKKEHILELAEVFYQYLNKK